MIDGVGTCAMDGDIIATDLDFPEGPVWLDGTLLFTEITGGRHLRWRPTAASSGSPTPAAGRTGRRSGPDGSLYVTQNGGMDDGPRIAGRHPAGRPPDGTVELVATEVAGDASTAPTTSRSAPTDGCGSPIPRGAADPAKQRPQPGRIFALDVATGEGELVVELGPVFPNGIGFLRRRHAGVDRVVRRGG